MRTSGITPGHPLLKEYARSLAEIQAQGYSHELALRPAFQNLLADSARLYGWTFISEPTVKVGNHTIRPDGLVRDSNNFPRGYWEAKDSKDKLEREIDRKLRNDYPSQNTIFEDTNTGRPVPGSATSHAGKALRHEGALRPPRSGSSPTPNQRSGSSSRPSTSSRSASPTSRTGSPTRSRKRTRRKAKFERVFDRVLRALPASLNPNIRRDAVDEMLVQHLLTERLFRTIFDDSEFTRRNVIAIEVETVIDALVSESFSRSEYLAALDPFYKAIESAARTIEDFSEKQHFLNTVYERFFQGYSRQGRRHPRDRVHAAADRRFHVPSSRAGSRKRSSACRFLAGREHPRPLHGHRETSS